MLSASAYSFRQKSRLAVSLSWIGGYVNVVVFLATGAFVSHMSGVTTQFGRGLGTDNAPMVILFGYTILAFTSGAILSGFLTETAKRRGWRSEYIMPIGLEALLLLILMLVLRASGNVGAGTAFFAIVGLGAVAMGLQNATITKVSGAVVRTTHLTGIYTDFGLEGVQYLYWWADQLAKKRSDRAGRLLKVSRRHPAFLRLLLLASIALSFGFGAVAGTLAFGRSNPLSLLAPIVFLAGLVFVDYQRPTADIRELDPLDDPDLSVKGIFSQLLPPDVCFYRATCQTRRGRHRAPDFQLWVDRVPSHSRILVLAVSPHTRFNENAVMDLHCAVQRLKEQHRELILTGITTHQFRAIDAVGGARLINVANLCPDMEFAIARALSILEEVSPPAARRFEQAVTGATPQNLPLVPTA